MPYHSCPLDNIQRDVILHQLHLGAGFSVQPVSAEFPSMVHTALQLGTFVHQEGLVSAVVHLVP